MNVVQNDEGQFEVKNASGKVVEGPFDTNSAAWKAIDRLDNASYDGLNRKRKPKKARGGKGYNPPKRHAQQLAQKAERKMKREAAKAPGWVRDIAAVKFDPAANRAFRDYKLGTLGPASEVKRIDPAVYLAEKAAEENRG